MKKLLLFIFLVAAASSLSAQTVISDTPFSAVDPSARLDIQSTSKGLLIPRMTTSQRDMINGGTFADGLLIYNTDQDCFQFYSTETGIWSCLSNGEGFDATDDAWVDNSVDNRIEMGTLSDGATARTDASSLFYLRDDGKLIFGDDLSTGVNGESDHSGFVNIRRSSGSANLKISSSDGSGIIWMESYGDTAVPVFNFAKGRGTDSDDFSTQQNVQDGDILGGLHFWGFNSNTERPSEQMAFSAAIRAEVDGAITTGNNAGVPTRLTFTTTSDSEAAVPNNQKMVLSSEGNLGINTENPLAILQVETEQRDASLIRYNNDFDNDFDLDLIRVMGTQDSPGLVSQEGVSSGGLRFRTFSNANITEPDPLNLFPPIAEIKGVTDGTVSAASTPGRIEFKTTPDGSNRSELAMNLDSEKNLTVEGSVTSKGGLSANIRMLGTGTVLESDHTILVTGAISLPAPSAQNTGKIYYLVHGAAGTHTITGSFQNAGGTFTTYDLNGTPGGTRITVQSNGTSWWIINVN